MSSRRHSLLFVYHTTSATYVLSIEEIPNQQCVLYNVCYTAIFHNGNLKRQRNNIYYYLQKLYKEQIVISILPKRCEIKRTYKSKILALSFFVVLMIGFKVCKNKNFIFNTVYSHL